MHFSVGFADCSLPLSAVYTRVLQLLITYAVSQKSIHGIFNYSLKSNYRISIIFGTNISDKTFHQMTIQFPTSPNVCFCTT